MYEITKDSLKKKHGEKADEAFAEIALLGGWGEVGPAENQLDPDSALDLRGVLDDSNKAITAAAKNRIKDLISGEAPKAEEKK